jgi:hypothetical protein
MSTAAVSREGRTPDISPDKPSSQPLKSQRVLACVLCQQRKVKCDRKFPCANCIKFRAQCVPATLAQRRRRRRPPERELLERLRKYEDMLRQNNIVFEPLNKDSAREKESVNADSDHDSNDEHMETGEPDSNDEHMEAGEPDSSAPSTTLKSEGSYEAKYVQFRRLFLDG